MQPLGPHSLARFAALIGLDWSGLVGHSGALISGDNTCYVLAEAGHLVFGQQTGAMHEEKPPHRTGSAEAVKDVAEFFVPLLNQIIEREVSLMRRSRGIGACSFDIRKHPPTEAIKRDRLQSSQSFPICLSDVFHRSAPPAQPTAFSGASFASVRWNALLAVLSQATLRESRDVALTP